MADFGQFRGFGDKLFQGQLPTKLGKIGSETFGFDTDAQAFFDRVTTAGGTLSTIEQNAINTLVIDLKNYSIWAKMKAIYPMVGASAAACAQNLKSSSFTGSFSTGWTFASTGVTPNGASAFMNTNFNTNTELIYTSSHLSFYSRTSNSASFANTDIGNNTISNYFRLRLFEPTNTGWALITTVATWANSSSVTNSLGFYLGSRTSSNKLIFQKNNTILATSTVNETNSLPNNITYIGALNNNGTTAEFSNRQCAFASIGDGLTDTEAGNFYTAVQAFQTTLSRQV